MKDHLPGAWIAGHDDAGPRPEDVARSDLTVSAGGTALSAVEDGRSIDPRFAERQAPRPMAQGAALMGSQCGRARLLRRVAGRAGRRGGREPGRRGTKDLGPRPSNGGRPQAGHNANLLLPDATPCRGQRSPTGSKTHEAFRGAGHWPEGPKKAARFKPTGHSNPLPGPWKSVSSPRPKHASPLPRSVENISGSGGGPCALRVGIR